MKIIRGILLFMALAILFTTATYSQQTGAGKLSFNKDWKFIKFQNAFSDQGTDKEPADLHGISVNDGTWEAVNLPHDWAIKGPFNDSLENNTGLLPWKGIGWYRKNFSLDAADKGKRIYIEFEGAMANAKIWLNGKYAGEWPYGYSSFRIDLTPFINFEGKNILAVRLDTKNWDSRWYPGAGIYRNVCLVKTPQVHIAYNGIYCTTPDIKPEKAVLSVSTEVENNTLVPVPVKIKALVYKLDKNLVPGAQPVAESTEVSSMIAGSANHRFRMDINVSKPVLWDLESPELYRVVVEVKSGSDISETGSADIGFRTLKFTARDGFYLNGKKVEVKGVCNHHDLGAIGAAFNMRAAERQLELLKEMGCNAIRTSHNPPAPGLLDLCDRMGFLVQDEAFDAWRRGKKRNDYNKLFDAWHEEDLRALVRRDRNHPSVFIWSIGNEVPDQGNFALAESLKRIVKSEDYTRPVTSGCDNPASGINGFQKALDVFGINYRLGAYAQFFALKDNENLPFHSSESASTVSSRGEYFFPVVQGDLNNNLPGKGICQISSYDLAYPGWASTPDQQWEMIDKFPATFGEFVWTGFDYLGEPTPYFNDITDISRIRDEKMKAESLKWLEKLGVQEIPSRSSYFGIFDLAGFKKDRFWLYQSKWRPEFPMVHILPHWNWPERKGLVTPVHIYTSGDEAELFLNGKSLGKKKKGQYEYRLRWDDVVYQPGELRAVAYKNGVKWAEETIATTGKPLQLSLSADRQSVKNDGYDLVYVTVRIDDSKGKTIPGSNNLVQFSVTGPGKIVAVDNGDATSHQSFVSREIKAYNGLCLVILKADEGAKGEIILKAVSKGLKEASIKLPVSN